MTLNTERKRRIDQIFEMALSLPPEGRKSFLDAACSGDDSLRQEIEEMLLQKPESEKVLATPAQAEAAKTLAEESNGAPVRVLAGRQLSHYRILEQIGEGGMGVVYRARDEHLLRDVAVKVLPAGTLNDESARKRFRKEAIALSKLNYPNIGTIHDFDTRDGIDFLVMEYVEGTTLKERLVSGPLPMGEVFKYGQQLADGLIAAHAQGVVHRDLKPGNLIVTRDGRLKILDFGLAKLLKPMSETAPTESQSDTPAAAGTLPYMSPEQLRGQDVDARSDLFSFGAVLYEMATGTRAFRGNTPAMLCDAILNKTPTAPARLKPEVPVELERIILRSLEKDPRRRYQAANEIRAHLHRCNPSDVGSFQEKQWIRSVGKARTLAWGLPILISLVAFAWLWTGKSSHSLPQPFPVTGTSAWAGEPQISPDGSKIVYISNESGKREVWLTDTDGNKAQQLTFDEADNSSPAWFADGRQIAYASDRGGSTNIWTVSVSGGSPILLVPHARYPAISPDGKRIAFARPTGSGHLRIGIASLSDPGDVRPLTDDTEGLWDHRSPTWSPDSTQICYSSRQGLRLVPVAGGPARPLTSDRVQNSHPVWDHKTAYIYYSSPRGGTMAIWRVKAEGGEPERVTFGTGRENHPSISWDGQILVHATTTEVQQCVLLDRQSGTETIAGTSEFEYMATIAADGSKIFYTSPRGGKGNNNLWVQDFNNGTPSGSSRQLTDFADAAAHPAISPDTKWVAFYRIILGQRDIWIVPAAGGKPIQFTNHPAADVHPAWSPDGLQLAFASGRTGGYDIWVAPVKDGKRSGPEHQITTGPMSADMPAWSPDGKSIAFREEGENRNEAWLISPQQGSPARRVTTGAEDIRRVRWDNREATSGDLLVSATWGTNRVALWSVSPLTGTRKLFSPSVDFGERDAPIGLFDLSRNGRFLIFSRSSGRKGQIWVLKKTTGTMF